ncbi:OX-2 membrane glycoprotein-like isoform X2 [Esox lucius]|uniref:OX-2 membrane glycoprotein-like isoform X2 n=1 Tax=Esox lucius TaxID=8010 RepID=UPI001477740F|nr:OX-2 membrane glycoprotein-like isoform X2 [Esox lucius]
MCVSALTWLMLICLWTVIVRIQGLSQLVETQQVVIVSLGGDVKFSCRLMEPKDVLQVTWQKETPGGTENVASYNKRFGPEVNPPFNMKVLFLYVGLQNCSVIIRRVSREDESCYKCLFNIYPDGAISGRTCLQVNELYGPTLLLTQNKDTHPLFSGLTVSCSATGRPAPVVDLFLPVQFVLENSTTVSVTHPNGTVTVTITSTVAVPSLPDNIPMVRCVVSSGSAIKEGSIKIPTLLVGRGHGWISGHGTVVVAVTASLGLIVLICTITWCLCKKTQRNETPQQDVDESRVTFEL